MTQKEAGAVYRRLDPFVDIQEDIGRFRGPLYTEIFNKVRGIVHHQFSKGVRRGIKGYLFWGDVGVGKTAMSKALARGLRVPLLFVDGSDIARARYGESEQRIAQLFRDVGSEKRIILIDDAEGLFPRRDWGKQESWHIALNNVLFHEIDQLDTSNTAVILTTNEMTLMDKAIRDRLYEIEFPLPPKEVLIQIAKDRCDELVIPWGGLVERLEADGEMRTIRDVERAVYEYYAEVLS